MKLLDLYRQLVDPITYPYISLDVIRIIIIIIIFLYFCNTICNWERK